MSRIVFIAFWLLTASALVLGACAGMGDDPGADLSTELLDMEIIPNPANLLDEAMFIASFKDHDGDTKNATVTLTVFPGGLDDLDDPEDEEQFDVPVTEVIVEGDKAGTIRFSLEILAEYDGTCRLTLTDEAGNTSEEVDEYLFVNLVHPDETK